MKISLSLDLSKVINFMTKLLLEAFVTIAGVEIAKRLVFKSKSEVITYIALSFMIFVTVLFIVKIWKNVEFIK